MMKMLVRSAWLASAVTIAGAGVAAGQGATGDTRPATDRPSVPPAGTGSAVQSGQGGVAGTGLGNVPTDDQTGKGLSVKGPAGQLVPSNSVKAP